MYVPFTYAIDVEHRLVVSKGSGVLTKAEILTHMDQLKRDSKFDPNFNQLADFTEITEAKLTSQDIAFIAQMSMFSPHSKRAIVAARTVHFGMARMYELMRQNAGVDVEHIHVFDDVNSARRWLEISDR